MKRLQKVMNGFPPAQKRSSGMKKVLLVDGDKASLKALKVAFVDDGFEVAETNSGIEAIVLVTSWQPELMILDANIRDAEIREVIRVIRKYYPVRIIVLSSCDQASDGMELLDLGANDFVCKPVKIKELMARVRAVTRRRAKFEGASLLYQMGQLKVDSATRTVTLKGRELHFTRTEFETLRSLAAAKGEVVTPRELTEAVWGSESKESTLKIRVLIGLLRKKLEVKASNPKIIITERGVGYRLVAPDLDE